jgi:O-acetyl-ADP-ribose deacetylase (regulator of RNase III)
MNNLTILILSTAFVSLIMGIVLYLRVVKKSATNSLHSTNQIAWLLIALFPTLIIFAFFPQTSINGTILGFSVGGAVALFALVWVYGERRALEAVNADDLNDTIRNLREALARCEESAKTEPTLAPSQTLKYRLRKHKLRSIGTIAGNLENVKNVDIWVNSENTNMQMSRYYEGTISGIIRYLGGRRNFAGEVLEDVIGNDLRARMAGSTIVEPATVLVTDSGELKNSHNVKKILHVAAVRGVRGVPGKSYHPVENVEQCVTKALEVADSEAFREFGCKSILFPLLGAGAAGGDVTQLVQRLLNRAIDYLESTENGNLQSVYFLAWSNLEFETCKRMLDSCEKLTPSN